MNLILIFLIESSSHGIFVIVSASMSVLMALEHLHIGSFENYASTMSFTAIFTWIPTASIQSETFVTTFVTTM